MFDILKSFSLPALLLFLPPMVSADPDDDLAREKEHLNQKLFALEGYLASCTADKGSGEMAYLEVGADFKSGWAFTALRKLKPSPEKINTSWKRLTVLAGQGFLPSNQIHFANPTGLVGVLDGKKILAFEGHPAFFRDFRNLSRTLAPNVTPNSFLYLPVLNITRSGLQLNVYPTNLRICPLIQTGKKLLHTNHDTSVFAGEEGARLTFDRKTGILLSKTLKTEQGEWHLKRTSFQKNPGWPSVAKEVKDIPPASQTIPFSRNILAARLYGLIFFSLMTVPQPLDLKTHLVLQERVFIDFLRKHPPRGQLMEKPMALEFARRIVGELAAKTNEPPAEVARRTGEINPLFRRQAFEFQAKLKETDQEISKGFFHKELRPLDPMMENRKKLIDAFIVHCLFRANFEDGLEAYRKEFE
jgi:hypothetical protein